MAIRNDLLYSENIITKEELEVILNPLSDEILKEYGSDIGLSGYIKVVEEYILKINDYINYGNFNKSSKNYVKKTEIKNIIRYHRKVNETEYIDCLSTDEGAEPYNYSLNIDTYEEDKKATDNIYSILDETDDKVLVDIPNEMKPLLKCDITEIEKNFEKIEELFYTKNILTAKVCINYLENLITTLKQAKEDNKQDFLNKKYFDKSLQYSKLPFIKDQYIDLYNAYEDGMALQSLFIKKAKHTDGKELDKGL